VFRGLVIKLLSLESPSSGLQIFGHGRGPGAPPGILGCAFLTLAPQAARALRSALLAAAGRRHFHWRGVVPERNGSGPPSLRCGEVCEVMVSCWVFGGF